MGLLVVLCWVLCKRCVRRQQRPLWRFLIVLHTLFAGSNDRVLYLSMGIPVFVGLAPQRSGSCAGGRLATTENIWTYVQILFVEQNYSANLWKALSCLSLTPCNTLHRQSRQDEHVQVPLVYLRGFWVNFPPLEVFHRLTRLAGHLKSADDHTGGHLIVQNVLVFSRGLPCFASRL